MSETTPAKPEGSEPATAPEPAAAPEPAVAPEVAPTAEPSAPALPPVPASRQETKAVARTRSLIAGIGRWVKRDGKRAIRYAILGLLFAWLSNVVIIAAVYNGVAKVPGGSNVTAPSSVLTGVIFWTLAMTLIFGAVEYTRAVGSKRFWADVRGFPNALAALVRSDGAGARFHLLWGFAGAMLAAAFLSGSVALLVGVGWLALLAAVLRPLMVGLLMLVWRKVVGLFSRERAVPPSQSALAVSAVGIVLALIGAYVLPTAQVKVVVALLAGGAAFLLSRPAAPAPGPTALVIAVLGGAWLLLAAHPAFAHDGGFSECGGSWGAWLSCGGGVGDVVQNGLLGGISGAGGSVLGGGLGQDLGKDRIRRGWGATFDGGFDGFMDQFQYLGQRDVADPLSLLAALAGAPREALVTDGSRNLRDFLDSGAGRDLYEEFAADPLKFANDRGIGDWLREFPNQDHGPITQDDLDRYSSMYDDYNRAVAAGDDYNANRLRGMLAATTIWIGAQFVEPEMAVEGIAGRLGTRTAATGLERTATGLAGRELVAIEQIEKGGVNQSMRVVFDDGGRAILKPDAGGRNTIYESLLDGSKSSREVGTYVTDRHLGFNQVPETVAIDDPNFGRSAMQEWKDSQRFPDIGDKGTFYAKDEQMMAVRDYITGNHDRHLGNVLMSPEGGMVAIDHGESFPTGKTGSLMTNEFLARQANTPLDPAVVDAVRSVDQTALRQELQASGLSQQQVDGAINRLNEIATHGQINGSGLPQGQAWAVMNKGPVVIIRPPVP